MNSPLAIYLSDHYTGATGGVELIRRMARAHRGTPAGSELDRLRGEVEDDRDALRQIMGSVGVQPGRYRVWAAVAGEKIARLKPNGRLVRRSPLSSVIELEAMLMAVDGKAAGWRLLEQAASEDPRLDPARLAGLRDRASDQANRLDSLRCAFGRGILAEPARQH